MLLDELAPYRRDDGANLSLTGPPVTLNPRCALTLGLAIHELATNAAKYGALAVPQGRVSLCWTLSEGELALAWTEEGGPPVAAPPRSGFGMRLLDKLASRWGCERSGQGFRVWFEVDRRRRRFQR